MSLRLKQPLGQIQKKKRKTGVRKQKHAPVACYPALNATRPREGNQEKKKKLGKKCGGVIYRQCHVVQID